MAKKTIRTEIDILEDIKNSAFEMGTEAKNVFIKTKNSRALRDANISYRVSMQAIRDKARYKVSK